MNHWHNEFMAEIHRQDILDEVQHIHLDPLALRSRLYRPGLFERSMYNFANWMISTGKQLRKRYEVPCADCPSPSGSFAH
ncbi:MAG TPA: hypothetical protein VFY26_20245 [Anaerolineales bacterium]|nr:hypothetical protein [Anaerolineales bacterium]